MKNENWACFSPILSRNCNIFRLYKLYNPCFSRCRLMRTMTPPSSSPVSGAGTTTARPTAPTAATPTCRTTSPSATTATRRRRGRRTPWPSEHGVKQLKCTMCSHSKNIYVYSILTQLVYKPCILSLIFMYMFVY